MEPASAPPRPVWIVPTIAAALALLFIVVIALEARSNEAATPPVTTTSSTTTTAVPTDVPPGNRGNPFPIGTSGELDGWRLTVAGSSRAGDAVVASVQLIWDGTDQVDSAGSVAAGDPTTLVLKAQDAAGKLHGLGGAACAGNPITNFTTGPPLDVGQTTTAAFCWTVPKLGHGPVGLLAGLTTGPDQELFALG